MKKRKNEILCQNIKSERDNENMRKFLVLGLGNEHFFHEVVNKNKEIV